MYFPTIFPVTCHTNHVGQGSTFVAIKGTKHDGVDYIPQAIERGAKTVVVQEDAIIPQDILTLLQEKSISLKKVSNTRRALAQLSAQAHGFPAQQLKIMAVTGTKGKTTSVFVLEAVLRKAGFKTALLSSVHNVIDGVVLPTQLTTQQPDYLHTFFRECVRQHVTHVIMEVAAQAFSLNRVEGVCFDGIIFTNFDATHAEFYATTQDYFAAKLRIFEHLRPGAPVVVNNDNAWCRQLAQQYPTVTTFSLTEQAHVKVTVQGDVGQGILFNLYYKQTMLTLFCPTFIGLFSVYNLAGVAILALELGIAPEVIAQTFENCAMVPGRLERYPLPNHAVCIIDYAHNPLSFESILSTLRPLTEQLLVVFGCGGDRDATMRPIMGTIAATYADLIVLTTDNPRSEDAAVIVQHIIAGIPLQMRHKMVVIMDRKEAIEKAYNYSSPGSIIALLGKGRDEYQHVGTVKTKFSELEIVRSLQKNAFE